MKAEYPCDLCGSAKYTPLEVARPYVGTEQVPVVCNDCGFVYVRERRSEQEVIDSWKDIYASGAYDPTLPGVRARLFYVAEWIDRQFGLKDKDVMDYGGGTGALVAEMCLRRKANAIGYDPAFHDEPFLATVAERRSADIITITWTLENCTDAIGMLRKARALLKPDGHLIVATGSRILVPPRKRMGAYFGKNPADTHCFRWSRKSLGSALAIAGFEVVAENDWQQNDVLLLAAKPTEFIPLTTPHDDPKEVAAFFDKWARDWP